ncbi:MAG: class I SAM-dependent methyltransferase [Nanohaloarchaea archaeon]|nr:class I SAM-dependent methyltransferase [Candidatus Nanohaloarchaea archaeon]
MRDTVKKGYEEGDYEGEYRENREIVEKEKQLFKKLSDNIKGDKVLDLGCGTGVPFDRYLVDEGFDLTGIDISEKHIRKARENIPEAKFLQGDFFDQDFGENSFDAVVSFYAIFHIPREEHQKLFEEVRPWLKDDGALLVTMGAEEMEQHKEEIGGGELVWSSYSREKNKELIEKAGFNILETYVEDWREETHLWILAEPN